MQTAHNNMLPGILDESVEFFSIGKNKVAAMHNGSKYDFDKLPSRIHNILRNEIGDQSASINQLEKYAYDHFRRLDRIPDIDINGNINKEYTGMCLVVGNGETISKSEIKVLKLVHLSDKEIADKLFRSRETVLTHWQNMRRKTGLTGKVELALWASQKDII